MPDQEATSFDINKAAAEFVQNNIEDILKIGTGVFKTITQKVQLQLDRTYKAYLKCVAEKCSRTKSFFIRSDPAYLYQFYVPLSVKRAETVIEGVAFHQIPRCSIIVGSGGSGKSMLMRHLVLNSIFQKAKVPVFVQLQHLNQSDLDLDGLVKKTLSENKFSLDGDYIARAIEEGHFALFLDGLDEVIEAKRKEVGCAIRDFARNHDKCSVIVSSRHDPELEGWQDFALLKVQPLSLELAYDLVTRLPFDEDMKAKFLDDLRKFLFKKHHSFLSNPLLLSIMLLTYGQSANIPDKLNVFYNQAYEALFERHDALKGGYARLRRTKLDIQDFARVFSAFCLQSFDKGQLEFSHVEALGLVERSKDIVGIETEKSDFLKDCLQAVCLLVEDGLKIVFSHRSFQEYFTARFIAESSPQIQKRLIEKYSSRIRGNSVFALLYEIRPDILERHFLLPKLDNMFEFIGYEGGEITIAQYLKYAKTAHTQIEIMADEIFGAVNGKDKRRLSDLASFTLRHCGGMVAWDGFEKHTEKSKSLKEKYVSEDGKPKVFILENLGVENEFVKDLFKNGSYFSVETLRVMAEVRDALKERAAKKEASLDEILKRKRK